MRTYLSGQISGLEYDVFHANFQAAEDLVKEGGLEPVNPLGVQACGPQDCNGDPTDPTKSKLLPNGSYLHSWQCYMRYDIKAMMDCQAIAMLPNFLRSGGAFIELDVARKVGLRVYTINKTYTQLTEV